MPSTSSVRRGFALIGGPVLGVLFATAVTAGPEGPRHAHGTFVDGSGSAIGSLHLTQDARGVVHVNVQVQGLSTGLNAGWDQNSRNSATISALCGIERSPGCSNN